MRRAYGTINQPGDVGRRSAASLSCRRCGRPTGNTPGVIEHIDHSPGGVTWAEHAKCPPTPRKPRRDYLAPDPDDWRL